ncbi:hypothetical protein D1007_34497 [Hordeum vulgare]|nr:hypothetical protein D1007_34497 [Hordeum vulgare]
MEKCRIHHYKSAFLEGRFSYDVILALHKIVPVVKVQRQRVSSLSWISRRIFFYTISRRIMTVWIGSFIAGSLSEGGSMIVIVVGSCRSSYVEAPLLLLYDII